MSATALGGILQPRSLLSQSSDPKRLGVCVFSYLLRWPTVARGQGSAHDTLQFIDHCHRLGAGGVQLSLRPEAELITQVRAAIEAKGMYLEGQIGLPRTKEDMDKFEAQVRSAKAAGAVVIRTACLSGRRYETFQNAQSFRDFAHQAERSLSLAEPVVRKHQIRLAVENHKDWRVPEMLRLLDLISSEYVGVCVDTGNSIALLEDPLAVVEAYAPYAFSTHLKDMAVQEFEKGFLLSEVPLGEGFLDLPQMVSILRRHRPEVQFSLEMITRDPLLVPCLTRQYWATFETLPGWCLAATLSMIRANPAKHPLPRISHLSQADRIEAEDVAVRKCLLAARPLL